MTRSPYKHVFGPVPSRRLGRSLGVDLVPFKTCTYDCIYCQLGRTTLKTLERKEYVPVDEVLSELERKLAEGAAPDYVTLSGSGEPTLHSGLADVVSSIKRMTDVPLAVLTNGSLLWDPAVREGLLRADLVIPSLDAGDERLFQYVNRPHPDLSFERMAEGLRTFRREFTGQIWLEVLLLGGATGAQAEVEKIARLVEQIEPDKVQLNTVTRPPAEEFAAPVPLDCMNQLAKSFRVRTEVIADFQQRVPPVAAEADDEEILDLLRRRPCTCADIARGLGLHVAEAAKRIAMLERAGRVASRRAGECTFYAAAEGTERTDDRNR